MSTVIKALDCLLENPLQTVEQLDIFSDSDWSQLLQLNPAHVVAKPFCLHHVIEQQVSLQPHATAVVSNEGSMTYAEMDQLANRLAHQLLEVGAGPEVIVSFYLDKSMWTVIAMLAILKAGSGCVALDPSYPRHRLQSVVTDTKSTLVVTNPAYEERMSDLGLQVVFGDADSVSSLPPVSGPPRVAVGPHNIAFIVATSGSTGTPKCAVLEHQHLYSFLDGLTQMGMTNKSRVGHFSSYAFDASIMDTILALTRGACVCVIPEEDRFGNLGAAMNRLGVTWAYLTATVLRMVDPQDIPLVETIVTGAERVPDDLIQRWANEVNLIE